MSILLHNPGASSIELIEIGITLRPLETRDVTRRIGGLLATANGLRTHITNNTIRVVRSTSPLVFWSATDGIRRLALNELLNNFSAERAPTATDDEAAGYSFGSLWRWGTRVWQCIRADVALAVWQELAPVVNAGAALNRYYGSLVQGETNGGGQTIEPNRLMMMPFYFPPGFTFNRIGFEQSNSAGSGSLARLAIYNSVNGVPSTLQATLGTASMLGSGQREIAVSFTSPAEVFWVVFQSNQSVSLRAIRNGFVNTNEVGSTTATFGSTQTLFVPDQPFSNGMPNSFPTTIQSNTSPPPHIWFRRVP